MDDLIIPKHALDEMQNDGLTDDDVFTVVGDCDERIEQHSGRTEFARLLDDGRYVVVVVEDDGFTVVTAWLDKRRSRRRRRR
jgi:hypothetical protein